MITYPASSRCLPQLSYKWLPHTTTANQQIWHRPITFKQALNMSRWWKTSIYYLPLCIRKDYVFDMVNISYEHCLDFYALLERLVYCLNVQEQ